ncbi:Terminase small subunit [Gemmata sp. SH-PL17]|uniref:terminase small subunit n=1 Tax=Gemmata sp. SH-PL17 TaxID=1630693 RepID=UPI00078CDA99|nr:terminase small subunit [Gemmata sp. SH-PL17]AMV26080.1 Terminase small subunit [Gemmata sp. SH-PL17]
MPKALNPKQLKFVELYLAGRTAIEAYALAGYKGRGESARAAAGQLLANVTVQQD